MTIQKNNINFSKTLVVDENTLPGIILSDRHAKLIRKRNKKEIIKVDNVSNFIGKPIYLCGKKVYGIIILNEPHRMDLNQFKSSSHSERHKITDKELLELWPDAEKFYGYSFRIKKIFKKPLKYKYVDSKDFIDEVELMDKPKTKMRDLNNLNREHDRKLEEEQNKKESKPKVESKEDLKIEEKNMKSNSRLDKYYKELNSLKALEFGGKYKEIAKTFLELYELYLEKGNSKIYDKNGVILKPAPETPGDYVRVRIRNPRTMVDGSFRTITISAGQGIKAVIGKLKKNPDAGTKIQSVLFDKEKWDTKRALAWVASHKEDLKSLDSDELKEKTFPKKVEVKEEIETKEVWICPHCNEEIGEKSLYCNENGEWFHRPCIEKGPIELPKDDRKFLFPIEKNSECYVDDGYIPKDKDKGKPEEKWVFCDNCKNTFDYYKQLLDDKSTLLCPHCGALVIYKEI